MEYIQLKENTSLKRFGIRTADGQDTGEYIEIDIEDFDLPFKANECQKKHINNVNQLKNQLYIIEKKQDSKDKNEILSENQKASIEAHKKFFKAEEEALDELLGSGATKKLLGGRKPYITMYDDINEYLEKIVPTLKDATKHLEERIKSKYGVEKEDNVL